MDGRDEKGLSPRQGKSIMIRLFLLFVCVFVLYGEYTLQNTENSKKEPEENVQDSPLAVETYEKENPVIMNEYQTKYQDAINTYEIKDGKLYGSGENASGQLGIGEITSSDSYMQQVLIAENVIHMDACGDILVLQEDGTLYTMGANLNGELGNGTARPVRSEWYAKEGTVYSSEPVHVMDDIAFIAADHSTAAAISKKGDLWVWGDNSFGEIGNSRRGNGMPSVSTDVVSEPYLVLKKIKEVYFEDYTVYAVDFQNQKYCWGKNATASPKLEASKETYEEWN